jgi:hypothetical protein
MPPERKNGPVQTVTTSQLARARQHSLLLGRREARTCEEVASWFGAMQAQDLASGKWSLGVRMAGATETSVDAAFERADVLRTWPMRGTIHVIASEDARWLLELTGVRALNASATRQRQLGLDSATAERAEGILDDALAGGRRLTRRQALSLLQQSGITTDGQRGYHLLWHAAQTGRICIGPNAGKEQTFVRLEDWAPRQLRLDRSAALVELAHRFFRSHGPTHVRDFAGWSGLTLTDARRGIAGNTGRLSPLTYLGEENWATNELAELIHDGGFAKRAPTVALPGFDEFMLGYKDRSIQVPAEHLSRIVPGNNGMFRSTLIVDGRAIATWQRTVRSQRVTVTVDPFAPLSSSTASAARRAFDAYGAFLGLPVELS